MTAADAFWLRSREALASELGCDGSGLTRAEAAARLRRFGPNQPAPPRRHAAMHELVTLLGNPLVLTLLVAAALSSGVGEHANALVIAVIIGLGLVLSFVQTRRSARAAEALGKQAATRATVLRDGQQRELPAAELVPGDVVELIAGDLVPADGLLLWSHDLYVDQAMLTGESLPVEKQAGPVAADALALEQAGNAAFAGSSVVSGTARLWVVRTGAATAFGHVAAGLNAAPPPTAFERGMAGFALMLLRFTIALVVFAFLVLAVFKHQPLQALLFAIALAVGLTPELLPMIVTVTLARGATAMAGQGVIVKQLQAIENFGSIDVLASDKTGTLTEGRIALVRTVDALGADSAEVLAAASLHGAFETGIRSPLDQAIAEAAHPEPGWHKRDEVPFDFHRRRSAVVAERGDERLLVVKGAAEGLLDACTACRLDGGERPLDAALRGQLLATYERLGREGLRVLALATRAVPEQAAYGPADEHDLVFGGFLAFSDPPRAGAGEALRALAADGIRTVILTGDNAWVTRSVCTAVGLPAARLVEGSELAHVREEALPALAARTDAFVRLTPEQKVRIVRALQRGGHVVGFMGDGINDGPALRTADVGISVDGAADVARAAAAIILSRPGLDVLHAGVLEGRRAFANVVKYLQMGTSSNFGNMFSMAAAAVLLPFLPMLPTQILLNNLLYDLSQLAIPGDRVDPADALRPRHWDVGFIRRFMTTMGPVSSLFDLATFAVLYLAFQASPALFQTGWFVESLLTQTLVVFVIRTRGLPWRSRPSRMLVLDVAAVCAVALALPYTPLAGLLGLVPLPPAVLLALVALTAAYLACAELAKRWFFAREARPAAPACKPTPASART